MANWFNRTKGINRGLGAFLGVFTPTLLTILGVILYLRLGWVIGQRGLLQAVLIIVFANVLTLITTGSFSAISTNLRVGVGGAYYIVSRSLGLEIGGAIGLPLFLSQIHPLPFIPSASRNPCVFSGPISRCN